MSSAPSAAVFPTTTSTAMPAEDRREDVPQWKQDFLAKKKTLQLHEMARLSKVASVDDEPVRGEGENNATVISADASNGDHASNGHVIMDDDVVTESDCDSVDSSIDSSTSGEDGPSTGRSAGRSGGYSFVTAEQFDPTEPLVVNKTVHTVVDEQTNDSGNDSSSNELPYQPGFVSKLLNKWSSISYQTNQTSNYTSSAFKSVATDQLFKSKSLDNDGGRTVNVESKPVKSYSVDSTLSSGSVPTSVVDSSSVEAVVEGYKTVIATDSIDEELVKRRASYRLPDEIILIESDNLSPRELIRDGSVSCEDKLPDLTTDNIIHLSDKDSPNYRSSEPSPTTSEWHAQLPVHKKVLIAKSVFENSANDGLPVAPPRRRRSSKVISPPVLSPSLSPTRSLSPVSPAHTLSYNAMLEKESSPTSTPQSQDEAKINMGETQSEKQKSGSYSSGPRAKHKEQEEENKSEPPKSDASQPVPLFARFKLKQTNHKLYGNSEEQSQQNGASPQPPNATQSEDKSSKKDDVMLSPRSQRQRLAKAPAPQPPTVPLREFERNLTNKTESGQDLNGQKNRKDPIDRIAPTYLDSKITNRSKTSVADGKTATKTKVKVPDDKPASKSPDTQLPQPSSTSKPLIQVPVNSAMSLPEQSETRTSSISSIDSKSVTQTFPTVKPNSKVISTSPTHNGHVKQGSINTKVSPNISHNRSITDNNRSITDNKQSTEKPAISVKADDGAKPNNSIKSEMAVKSEITVKSINSVKAVNSVRDIPSPVIKARSSHPQTDNTNDLQAVLRRRRDNARQGGDNSNTTTDRVPVTNIDDVVLKSSRGSSSKPVFDSRKALVGKRKVPEYEKIRDGPVQKFSDTEVKVGKGCLKIPDSDNKTTMKNISFNDLDLTHEYLSEKIMIKETAKEEGAVYWDDPDHLQAAPDRSIDEPETNAATKSTKSSLRASLNNTPNISTGSSLSTHKSSYHGEYSFGQSLVTDSHVTRDDSTHDPNTNTQASSDSNSQATVIKPANDSDVMSWSSAGGSDLLF